MSAELEAFIDEPIRVSAEHHYHPTTFIAMRQRHGTIEAMNRLVVSGDVQGGFKRLNELGLLDYSIEAAILKFPDEFPRSSQECAAFRLNMLGSDNTSS